ncbi:hypothetical protein HJFPF1_05050 [Paramyrothecium foliicola]|nr:hypothetical protein HJFPF1_05050 [Paramyrothecium foliicola]
MYQNLFCINLNEFGIRTETDCGLLHHSNLESTSSAPRYHASLYLQALLPVGAGCCTNLPEFEETENVPATGPPCPNYPILPRPPPIPPAGPPSAADADTAAALAGIAVALAPGPLPEQLRMGRGAVVAQLQQQPTALVAELTRLFGPQQQQLQLLLLLPLGPPGQ